MASKLAACIFVLSLIAGISGCGTAPGQCPSGAAFTTETSGAEVGIGAAVGAANPGGGEVAQAFKLGTDGQIRNVVLNLTKVGSLGGADILTVSLRADAAGNITTATEPAATSLSSVTLSVSLIGTTAATYTFSFPSAVSISANRVYWIHAQPSYATSAANYVKWAAFDGTSGGGYSDGLAKYKDNGGNWSTATIGTLRDLYFALGC